MANGAPSTHATSTWNCGHGMRTRDPYSSSARGTRPTPSKSPPCRSSALPECVVNQAPVDARPLDRDGLDARSVRPLAARDHAGVAQDDAARAPPGRDVLAEGRGDVA